MNTRTMIVTVAAALVPFSVRAQSDTSSSATISIQDLAPQVSPYVGVPSTGGSTATCTLGRIAIGVAGSRTKFILKVTPICANVGKTGAFANVAPIDPAAVGSGGAVFTLQCSPGHVMTQLRVSYHTNTATYPFLAGLEIGCSTWTVSQWNLPAPSQVFATTGFDGWPVKGTVKCSSQPQPVRALRVRQTTGIKALSIVCDETT